MAGVCFSGNFMLMLRTGIASRASSGKDTTPEPSGIYLILAIVLALDIAFISFFYLKYGVPLVSVDIDQMRYSIIDTGGFRFMFPVYVYTNPFISAIFLGAMLKGRRNLMLGAGFAISALLQVSSALTGFQNLYHTVYTRAYGGITLFMPIP